MVARSRAGSGDWRIPLSSADDTFYKIYVEGGGERGGSLV